MRDQIDMSLTLLSALFISQGALTKSVEAPFKIGEDAIIVDATVNNRKCSLMFDTGFSGSVIVDSNLNIGEATGTMNLRDFVGQFSADTVKLKSLKLGDMAIDPTGMEAIKRPGNYYSLSYNTHCTGIMGFEVISKYVTEINFQNKKFIFHPNTVDITSRKPDGVRTFLAKMLPTGHNSMEMIVEMANGKKMTLALDTGNAFFATTHKDVLERVGLWESGTEAKFQRSSFVASGEVASWSARMKNAKIFGVPVPDSTWDIIDLPSSSAEHDGTIGFGFLSNFNVTIDYARRRVWLENWTGKTGNLPEGDIGLSVAARESDKRIFAVRVAPESPAAKAGIKVGDAVLSVDGQEIGDWGFRRLYNLFRGEKGTKVHLAMSRGGELYRVDVERDYLVNELK